MLETFYEEEDDIDIWARFHLDAGYRKYRVTIKEDGSTGNGRVNYEMRLSEKKPLSIDDGWTNWRKVSDFSYEGYRDTSFEAEMQEDLSDLVPVEFDDSGQTKLN
jgi:hypothetical protein